MLRAKACPNPAWGDGTAAGGVSLDQFVRPCRIARAGIDGNPVHDGLRRVAWSIQRGVEIGEFEEHPFADLARRWAEIDRRLCIR